MKTRILRSTLTRELVLDHAQALQGLERGPGGEAGAGLAEPRAEVVLRQVGENVGEGVGADAALAGMVDETHLEEALQGAEGALHAEQLLVGHHDGGGRHRLGVALEDEDAVQPSLAGRAVLSLLDLHPCS